MRSQRCQRRAPARSDSIPSRRRSGAIPIPSMPTAREKAPVFFAEPYGFWVVTRYDDVLAVLKDDEAYSSLNALRSSTAELPPEVEAVLAEGWPQMPVIVDTDPPLHTRIRGLINAAFTPRRIAGMEPTITRRRRRAPRRDRSGGRSRRRRAVRLAVAAARDGAHARATRGRPRAAAPLEQRLARAAPARGIAGAATRLGTEHRCAAAVLHGRPRSNGRREVATISWPRSSPPPVHFSRRCRRDVVMGVPFDLVIAGHVTVTRAIGNALLTLLADRSRLDELLADPGLWPAAIEEMLRLESPAQGLFRTTTRAVTLGGVEIPAGARLMVHYGSANRDELRFANADVYDAHREGLARASRLRQGDPLLHGGPACPARAAARAPAPARARCRACGSPGDDAYEYEPIFFARGLSKLRLEWDA